VGFIRIRQPPPLFPVSTPVGAQRGLCNSCGDGYWYKPLDGEPSDACPKHRLGSWEMRELMLSIQEEIEQARVSNDYLDDLRAQMDSLCAAFNNARQEGQEELPTMAPQPPKVSELNAPIQRVEEAIARAMAPFTTATTKLTGEVISLREELATLAARLARQEHNDEEEQEHQEEEVPARAAATPTPKRQSDPAAEVDYDMESSLKAKGLFECGDLKCVDCPIEQNMECMSTYGIMAEAEAKTGHIETVDDDGARRIIHRSLRLVVVPEQAVRAAVDAGYQQAADAVKTSNGAAAKPVGWKLPPPVASTKQVTADDRQAFDDEAAAATRKKSRVEALAKARAVKAANAAARAKPAKAAKKPTKKSPPKKKR
jgi:hypothetical protein